MRPLGIESPEWLILLSDVFCFALCLKTPALFVD